MEFVGALVIAFTMPRRGLSDERLDEIALAVKHFGEARLALVTGFGGDVGHRALRFEQVAEAFAS